MSQQVRSDVYETGETEVERGQTVIRIVLSVMFVLIGTVLEGALGLIMIFSLLWTLITRQLPSPRLRELANHIIAYYYRIGRYLTYNASRVPFPFDDFPKPLEGDAWRADERESDALGLRDWDEPDDAVDPEGDPR